MHTRPVCTRRAATHTPAALSGERWKGRVCDQRNKRPVLDWSYLFCWIRPAIFARTPRTLHVLRWRAHPFPVLPPIDTGSLGAALPNTTAEEEIQPRHTAFVPCG